ncbi:MAG: GatB/YqeY domain-containing protein [Candidatus Ryanbacteria bacterium]|nr:GatB/YqeY domain-containing protein [Candidatus Ryanbacteria bacterium]
MSLSEVLQKDFSEAIRRQDKKRVSTLRLLFAAIKNKEIAERKKDVGLGDEEILAVIQKEAKKRKESIAEFEKGGRQDLAASEEEELEILGKYMPKELSDAEVRRIIEEGVKELGGAGEASFGPLMKIIMPTLKGRASGDRIAKIALEVLKK